MITTEKQTERRNHSNKWTEKDSVITGDQLIDAYMKGKEAGKSEYENVMLSKFQNNIKLATESSEAVMKQASKLKIQVVNAHIKAESVTKFSALIVVDLNDFISDKFRKIYTLSREIKTKYESTTFTIDYTFMPFSDHIDENRINSDGFFLKYEKK